MQVSLSERPSKGLHQRRPYSRSPHSPTPQARPCHRPGQPEPWQHHPTTLSECGKWYTARASWASAPSPRWSIPSRRRQYGVFARQGAAAAAAGMVKVPRRAEEADPYVSAGNKRNFARPSGIRARPQSRVQEMIRCTPLPCHPRYKPSSKRSCPPLKDRTMTCKNLGADPSVLQAGHQLYCCPSS